MCKTFVYCMHYFSFCGSEKKAMAILVRLRPMAFHNFLLFWKVNTLLHWLNHTRVPKERRFLCCAHKQDIYIM